MTIHRAGPVYSHFSIVLFVYSHFSIDEHRAGPVSRLRKMTIHRAGPVYSLVLLLIYGVAGPWNETSRERIVQGTKRPRNETSRERNVSGTKRPLRGVTKHRTGRTGLTGPKYWSFSYEKG